MVGPSSLRTPVSSNRVTRECRRPLGVDPVNLVLALLDPASILPDLDEPLVYRRPVVRAQRRDSPRASSPERLKPEDPTFVEVPVCVVDALMDHPEAQVEVILPI